MKFKNFKFRIATLKLSKISYHTLVKAMYVAILLIIFLFFIKLFFKSPPPNICGSLDSDLNWWNLTMLHLKEGSKDGIANYIIYRNIGLFLVGFIGVFLAFWRSKSLSRQATVAEQGHITERIIRASEQLGSPEIHVRIGAIYTLWRTATDTNLEADKITILDMLCAYVISPTENHVNDNSLSLKDNYGKIRTKNTEEKIRDDVQICLNLLSKQTAKLAIRTPYHCNFKNSYLRKCDLKGAKLERAKLDGANLRGANLEAADLRRAKLNGVDLKGAKLGWAKFEAAELANADLRGARLGWAKLGNAKLNRADLRGAILNGAVLKEAWLLKVKFGETELGSADLRGARLDNAKLGRTYLGGADLRGAYLMEAELGKTDLEGADLRKAKLNRADLKGADLKGAKLTEANLEGANLKGADLMAADLRGVKLRRTELIQTNFLMTRLWTIPNTIFYIKNVVVLDKTQRDILIKCLYIQDKKTIKPSPHPH